MMFWLFILYGGTVACFLLSGNAMYCTCLKIKCLPMYSWYQFERAFLVMIFHYFCSTEATGTAES